MPEPQPVGADVGIPEAERWLLQHAGRPSRWLIAIRAPFLLASLASGVLGLAWAAPETQAVRWYPLAGVLALLGLVLAHAAANVLNDYADASGDAANPGRLFPFSGGSRVIQLGLVRPQSMRALGLGLGGAAMGFGLLGWLSLPPEWRGGEDGWLPLALLASGLGLGWGYSMPPLRLAARGGGELAVALSFALGGVGVAWMAGASAMQPGLWPVMLGQGLLTLGLLWINQFPDAEADARVGKHTWVVRLGWRRARTLGVLWVLLPAALAVVGAGVPAWVACLPLIPAAWAAVRLWQQAENPSRLGMVVQAWLVSLLLWPSLLSIWRLWEGM